MHAPVIASEAQVVLAVNPAQHLGERNRLRNRKVRLLSLNPFNWFRLMSGNAEVERNVVRHSDAGSMRKSLAVLVKKLVVWLLLRFQLHLKMLVTL